MPICTANKIQIHYELSGPTHAPVLMLSNSLGTTMAMWDALVPHLRGRFRVLRYDMRGHGQTEVVDKPCTLDDLAADALGLLDALGLRKVHFAGLSLGGMVGQTLAARAPERIASLTLMATAAQMPTRESWAERAALVRKSGTAAILDATMGRWFTAPFVAAQSPELQKVRDGFVAIDRVGYAVCCGAIGVMDLHPLLAKITAPVLVVAGRVDPATPVHVAQDICDHIPQAELLVLPQASHLLAVEQPAAVASHLLAFLDRHHGTIAQAATGAVDFETGVRNRKAVLGEAHVERSLAKAGAFAMPFQQFISRMAWGEIWGDTRLPWKTRSIIVLSMMVALHREEEFKLHLKPALANGLQIDELQALLLQTSIYGGVPAANAAFRWVREVLGDELA
ncbi:MAG: 3-oxoadipate enol-lactonase [Hyphomicrobiales bacterium]|nr:3-oxoadipate enol-lactonase [Hyphomicrobiales bacterium]MDE2113499.1 3-oxoadipate enol-lactonase [Hyphomicrobiales bacterium]